MKKLLEIILPVIGRLRLVKYIVWGILSGLFNFLFINFITKVISRLIAGDFEESRAGYIAIFAAVILLYIWIRRALSLAIINLAQSVFWSLRKEIFTLALKAGYHQIIRRKPEIHTAILGDVQVLTDASLNIIGFFSSSILALSCFVYLSSISLLLFLITLVVAAVGVTVYYLSARRNVRHFNRSRELENRFEESVNAVLYGFKEIFVEPVKGNEIYHQNVIPVAQESYDSNMKAFSGFINNQMTGQVLFYILIAAVLLFFSLILHISAGNTVSFVFTLFYLLGSLETIMVLLPGIARAGVAAKHLTTLKQELESVQQQDPEEVVGFRKEDFQSIVVRNLEFQYGDKDRFFALGPVDLEVSRGEVIFIYGSNGSGKSTFLNTLLGLYQHVAGEIMLNGVQVTDGYHTAYRGLFSVVFSDFYLFNELYGVADFDQQQWEYYLSLFELEGKVTLKGRRLSTTDLSTGQRKRLALIVALMENKPILVMDEWAADQDPYFRKKFYTEIIPVLKGIGYTIIAITHDDKYYYCADRLFRMDYGKLCPETVEMPAVR
ncbi:cyclic peptide export ABC transporter [Chitinophaga sp. G-6-1-13]|uniref:Cyclic peptide export ABC transporter n=1 Tax=Chitinophaga fulva TaxID=2728842 RepID=A0A848GHC4_9BACT|nr:cyclic peptide export ABC transporter [Chitinophaga fulva]NML37864.1 cyclic peptide export ABC transporter [Chitinophaga fulva]